MNTYSLSEILQIARWQKYLLASIVLQLILAVDDFVPKPEHETLTFLIVGGILVMLMLTTWLAWIYITYRLAKALKSEYSILWVISVLLPLIALIPLLVLNHYATQAIKSGGFRVGVMGADIKEIAAKATHETTPAPKTPTKLTPPQS